MRASWKIQVDPKSNDKCPYKSEAEKDDTAKSKRQGDTEVEKPRNSGASRTLKRPGAESPLEPPEGM